ncbi:MAG: hypothetical protein KGI08_09625 [Thaumarchaeota archaeon]|nr:hypothetical protein [Nitrososphaerota archaeon]
MEKILVSVTIERALIEVGGSGLHESVQKWLDSEYHYNFSDCLEHPESLRKTLQRRCGDKYITIINKMRGLLGEVSEKEPFLEFMKKLGGVEKHDSF